MNGPIQVVQINNLGGAEGQVTVVNNGTMRSIVGSINGAGAIVANLNNPATVNIINNGILEANDTRNTALRAGIRTTQRAPVRIVNNGEITVGGLGHGILIRK